MRIDGACHCGAVSFSAEVDPGRAMVCHCTDCQVLSGAPFRAVVAAPYDSLVVRGATKSYVKVAQSGNRRAQVFCPECGTPLWATAPENPTSVVVRLGCVSQRAQFEPTAQIWQHSALPWVGTLASIPGSPEQQAFLPAAATPATARPSPRPVARREVRIVRLDASHVAAYRTLMLEAYVQAADAFTSTAEERAAAPMAWWVDRIASRTGQSEAFGAFADDSLIGSVALEYPTKPKTRHRALLLGMYLRPAARGAGVGRALLEAAIGAARARPGIGSLGLTVTEGNHAAIALYRSAGFVAWGTEPRAILTPSGHRGKVHMALDLARPPGAA